ncbi:hypothetical protein PR202_gb12308 [Eleusine coracana subsp. coracana]|uniref:LOB domain-containing protein n=1 Tax=Eleusine coracana subsp. coracana TaxID=191504 RepID=A0AAV5EPW6_ELECO|nr:hypothetical protein PR202_gb12308 [Eleusine coracana subsp. coracana]
MSSSLSSEEDVAPEEEQEATSSSEPCAACKHRRNKCPPNCPFAPYFPPNDGARFAAVQSVFGMNNVLKILADLPERHRADAVDSLVHQAVERQKNPTYGCASYVSFLLRSIREVRGRVAAAREKLVGHVGREAAFKPFDPATAPPEARQLAEASLAQELQRVREWDEMARADAEAEAAKAVAKNDGTRLASPGGRVRVQGPLQQPAGAQHYQAEQYAMMRRQITAGKQKVMPAQPLGGAQNQQMAEAGMTGVKRQAAAEDQFYLAAMAQAQQLAIAEEIARDPQMMMAIRQAAAAAGLTMDQYMMMMTMPQRHGQEGRYTGIRLTGVQNAMHQDQAQQYGNMGMMTRDQNMMMMPQQPTNAQQLSAAAEELMMMQQLAAAYANAMPGSGSGSGATIMSFLPEESANADAFLVPQQSQTVNAHGQEEACLAPLPPWLAGLPPRQQQTFLPGGSANADAFLNQQQRQNVQVQEEQSLPPLARWPHQQQTFLPGGGGSADAEAFLFQQQQQPLPQMVNTQFQEQSSLPSWLAVLSQSQRETFLTGGALADSEAFLVQQQLQQPPQLQGVNVLGSQVEPSLPPSQAGLPGQQQNDGGDQGQSIDLIARYWNQFPNLPPDGRQ